MEKLLEVKNLCVDFKTHAGNVKAIRDVSFDLHRGETLAIVGESGSGKSVTTKAIMQLLAENGGITGGEILYHKKDDHGNVKVVDIVKLKDKEMHTIRGAEISMVFQDPMTSLNPTMTIGKQIMEPIIKHQGFSKKEAHAKAMELISLVGIDRPDKRMKQYPHQFSGGMRQRIVIAIALACNPHVLICDEPTTALDVTIQAQIIDLIKDLQKKTQAAVIFITHDLGVVANIADRVAVMYAGKICEIGTADEVFYKPAHPYTWGLLASKPDKEDITEKLYSIPGTPPNLLKPPVGDAFALRSDYAMEIDLKEQPPLFKVSDTHYAATWLLHPNAPKVEPPKVIRKRYEKRGVNING
jgi:oligopeptide transport system ATP-binding protein